MVNSVMSEMEIKEPVLIVSGPTAGGKSELGISLATELNGEIVNMDSVQVYREADIGSAKVPPAGRRGIPHHLLDCLRPDEKCDAGHYCELAKAAILEIQSRGRLPILVGGSTMYLTLLLHGLAKLPPRDDRLRAQLSERENSDLYSELQALDPLRAACLHPNDRSRIIRALEACKLLDGPASQTLAGHALGAQICRGLILALIPEREELYARINKRTVAMLQGGLIEESKLLLERYGATAQIFRALGYAQVRRYLSGELDEEGLREEIAQETRRFAKRQLTYFRNEPRKRSWRERPAGLPHDFSAVNGKTRIKPIKTLDLSRNDLIAEVKSRLCQDFPAVEIWYLGAL